MAKTYTYKQLERLLEETFIDIAQIDYFGTKVSGFEFQNLTLLDEMFDSADLVNEPNWDWNQGNWIIKDVHRVWIDVNPGTLHLVFYSPVLSILWDEDLSRKKQLLLMKEFEKYLKVLLTEDVWMPNNEQFCFTELGKRVNDVLKTAKDWNFSPDIGLEKSDDGSYSWSS